MKDDVIYFKNNLKVNDLQYLPWHCDTPIKSYIGS